MKFSRLIIHHLAVFAILLFSCDKDFHSVGSQLRIDSQLTTSTYVAPVYTYQKKLNYFQTDGLPLGQLGSIQSPSFGVSEASITSQLRYGGAAAIFGAYTQKREDEGDEDNPAVIQENERVTAVFLDIPFFNNRNDTDQDGVIDSLDADPEDSESDTDGDGITDIEERRSNLNPLSDDSDNDGILDSVDLDSSSYEYENQVYEIDSIFGNRAATFNLKVYELTYFLDVLDPYSNFEKNKQYFSNTDLYEAGFFGATLCDTPYSLNFEELRFNYEEDDPDTEDIDEREKVQTRLSPRIRVPLDIDFFQQKILDKEGSDDMSSLENFIRFFRGIIIKSDNFSDDLYMLLDINNANIKIEYEYDSLNINDTVDDTSDDQVEVKSKTFTLSFSGVRFNTLSNQNTNSEIDSEIQSGQNDIPSKKSYLNGNGYFSTIKLFDEDNNGGQLLNKLRENQWLVSEANLYMYLDQDHYTASENENLVDRLYLFNYTNGEPLVDFIQDYTEDNNIRNRSKYIFGGFLEYDDLNQPYRYKFRITSHVNRLIRKDSTNFTMALVPANGINSIINKSAETSDQEVIKYPSTSILNPKGVVLLGSDADQERYPDKQIELEIYYTEY